MQKKNIHDYPGAAADVHWDERLCIHVGECGRASNNLFVGGRKPWCQPDCVSVNDVVDVVERCPSGALWYTRKDGGANETTEGENVVTVVHNGPLFVKGDLRIDGAAVPQWKGTGLEDYFNCGWYYRNPLARPLHGLLFKAPFRTVQYRLHLNDAVLFDRSIDVRFERGPDNASNGWLESVGYYYMRTPVAAGSSRPICAMRAWT